MKNLVILISSGGSNMAALARAARQDDWAQRLGARIAAVISNRPDAPGLDLARELDLPAEVVDHQRFEGREAFEAAMVAAIDCHQPALVVLAGFMRILTPAFVDHYAGRLVNIHPSLLPAFPGLRTHAREEWESSEDHRGNKQRKPNKINYKKGTKKLTLNS
jgi:phosphoribosylglycinamide formyltransferase-1